MTSTDRHSHSMAARCPLCKKPSHGDFMPFCGKACKDRDLLQWLGEGYRLPGPPADRPDAEYD